MVVVGMEFTPLGSVTLWIFVIGILGPFNGVSQTFHDGNYLNRLNIEIVLWDPGIVNLNCRVSI